MWQFFVGLAILGALGTFCRYGLDMLVLKLVGPGFPWGILAVNALGCLLFGVCYPLAEERQLMSPTLRLMILTGFMGSFTTFSTFSFHTVQMLQDGKWLLALGNVVSQLGLGLAAVYAGLALGQKIA